MTKIKLVSVTMALFVACFTANVVWAISFAETGKPQVIEFFVPPGDEIGNIGFSVPELAYNPQTKQDEWGWGDGESLWSIVRVNPHYAQASYVGTKEIPWEMLLDIWVFPKGEQALLDVGMYGNSEVWRSFVSDESGQSEVAYGTFDFEHDRNPPSNESAPVPEPGTMVLVGAGLFGFVVLRKRSPQRV